MSDQDKPEPSDALFTTDQPSEPEPNIPSPRRSTPKPAPLVEYESFSRTGLYFLLFYIALLLAGLFKAVYNP